MHAKVVLFFVGFCVALIDATAGQSPNSYTGYQVIQLRLKTPKEFKILSDFEDKNRGKVYIWYDVGHNGKVHMSFKEKERENILKSLAFLKLKNRLYVDDLGELIAKEQGERRGRYKEESGYNFEKHNDFSTIEKYLKDITSKYKDISKLKVVGTTFEKRPIYAVFIKKDKMVKKKVIMFECGVHAREWTPVETCVYLIKQLLQKSGKGTKNAKLLRKYHFVFMPVVNPDGYVYTWEVDRLWRKNRSFEKGNNTREKECVGVDINRNFDIHHCADGQSRHDPCSELNCGPRPFSERETRAVRRVARSQGRKLHAYFSLHSSGNLWMTPYCYVKQLPSHYSELKRVADIGAKAIKKFRGTHFKVGAVAAVLYECSGSSIDYIYVKERVKYSYALELGSSWIVEEKNIMPLVHETYQGLQSAMLALK